MIVLIGFMGAGKSTVGRLLATRLGLPFVDADDVAAQRAGRSIREVFATEGEAAFRDLEHAVVSEQLAGSPRVLALGGGAVEDARTRAALRGHQVVYLEVDLDTALARVGSDAERPVLRDARLRARFSARLTGYEEVATLVVPTAGRDPQDVAAELAQRLAPRS